jgi:hypothetical protein
VNAETISVTTGIASAAIAALGLLLNEYRRDEKKGKSLKSRQFFIIACVGIFVLAAAGIAVTLMIGRGPKDSVGTDNAGASPQLTEVQYKGNVGTICSDAKARARRILELRPQETVLGLVVQIEQDEELQIAKLQPPEELKNVHADVVSVWQRRISLLDSINHRLPQLGGKELGTELAAADKLTAELNESFKSLGVPECVIGA